jgi:hypothetical protein
MDIKVLELATKLTDKAMGADASATNWIGSEDKVLKFLESTAKLLNRLYREAPADH